MTSELVDKGIRKAIRTVGRRRIVDRVVEVIHHFNGENEDPACTVLNIGGGSATFTVRSLGHHGDRIHVEVHYGGSLMFSATSGPHSIAEGVDRRRVIRGATGSTVVDTFHPGLWMELLSVKRLVREAEQRKKREERERKQRARLRPAKPAPVREEDYDLAQRFAIRDQDVFLGR